MDQNTKFGRLVLVCAGSLSALLGLLLWTPISSAQMIEVKLPVAYQRTPRTDLSRMKAFEVQGRWADCAQLGNRVVKSQSTLQGWILRSWLKCAFLADREAQKVRFLPEALRAYEDQRSQTVGAWTEDNRRQAIAARLWLLENFMKVKPQWGDLYLDPLMMDLQSRENENMAKAWALTGDLSQIRHDLPGAEAAFVQSLKFAPQPSVQEKLRAVRLALNRPSPPSAPSSGGGESSAFSEVEQKYARRFEASREKNDLLLQMEDALAYLEELPNGLQAQSASQMILDAHQTLFDRRFRDAGSERTRLMHERAVSLMERADPERVREWVPTLYRRGDYEGSGRLATAIAKRFEKTPQGAEVLWYGARSAQLTGNYKKADRYYAQFFERHGGSEWARDANFQWALTLLQMEDYASSVARFERLLQDSGAERFELSARYWMIRALQAQGSPRAQEEITRLTSRFPASYYGIRLKAETQGNQFEWPFPERNLKTLKASMRLNRRQKKAWDRLLILRSNGWSDEALAETEELPLPDDPGAKILWAQELARAEAFPKVIRLLNEVSDVDPALRSMDVLRLGLPQVYRDEINTHAEKNNLHPILVRSLIRQESAFNPRAVSRSNAMGLMQLIPPTAREVATDLKMGALSLPEDAFRPPVNIQMGSAYLAKMLRQFSGSIPLALAAYNAGPRRIEAFLQARPELRESLKTPSSQPLTEVWVDELPWSETSFYVKAILRNSLLYRTEEQKKISLDGVIWSGLAASQGAGGRSEPVATGTPAAPKGGE